MRQHRKQGKSIFQFIFAAMLIVLGIEVAPFIPGRNDQYYCRESDCSGEYQCRGIGK